MTEKGGMMKWGHVEKTGTCWLWTRCTSANGYGKLTVGGRSYLAHRVSYLETVGPIPVGLVLDHLCRVRHCVNPVHLEPVTLQENLRRGTGLTAINANKTHCPQGHAYDEENTYLFARANGFDRRCRRCHREQVARTRRAA